MEASVIVGGNNGGPLWENVRSSISFGRTREWKKYFFYRLAINLLLYFGKVDLKEVFYPRRREEYLTYREGISKVYYL